MQKKRRASGVGGDRRRSVYTLRPDPSDMVLVASVRRSAAGGRLSLFAEIGISIRALS